MPVLWHEKITEALQEDANLALASFSLSVGERNALADLYGVSLRTCERWFASEGSQRRNCIPNEARNKRMIFMELNSRLEYIRLRCFLPFLFAVPGGIERDSGKSGAVKTTVFHRPTLASAIQIADLVVDGTSDGGAFLRRCWVAMYIVETGGEGPRKWTLTVEYKRPTTHDELYDEGPVPEDDGEEDDYNQYDTDSDSQIVWEPH